MDLIRTGNPEAQNKAAATLWNLARNADNNHTIGRCGGVGMLVGLLRCG